MDAAGASFGPDTPLEVGSLTKTFVAALVLALVEDGSLRLDDRPGRHVPGLPRAYENVTVRSLLNHTSGLPDYFEDAALRTAWLEGERRDWTADELLDVAGRLPPGEPGVFRYSNTNYVVVGVVVEAVTGCRLGDALRTSILQPLGLEHITPPREAADAPGSLVATAEDASMFLAALMRGAVISRSSLDEMLAAVPSDWPESQGYGLGIERIDAVVDVPSPCGAGWGHVGISQTTTVALTTRDGSRQAVVASTGRPTDDEPWSEIARAVWHALCQDAA